MEHYSFASLAHFRILLLPIGSISRTTFEQWAAEIRTLETLRLSDIPPGTKDDKGGHYAIAASVHPPIRIFPA
jgi:trafficking protein particle complex subunit 9